MSDSEKYGLTGPVLDVVIFLLNKMLLLIRELIENLSKMAD